MGIRFVYKGKFYESYGSVFVCITFSEDFSTAVYTTHKSLLLKMWSFNKVTFITFYWLHISRFHSTNMLHWSEAKYKLKKCNYNDSMGYLLTLFSIVIIIRFFTRSLNRPDKYQN